jgi:hypothetical protein
MEEYFTNLKFLIISSSNELLNEELKSILKTIQFPLLYSLKIKQKKLNLNGSCDNYLTNYDYILKNVRNPVNSLKIFSCSWSIPSLSQELVIN